MSKNDPPRSFDQEAGFAKHVISVDRDGRLKIIENDEEKYAVNCDSNSQGHKECEKYLDNIIRGIKNFKRDNKDVEVLFFVHGGLNNPKESLERAKQIYKDMQKDNQKEHPIYPIFVIWDSRGWSTYQDHLLRIRQGEESEYKAFTLLSSPFYLLTDTGNSIVNAPKSWLVTGEHMIDAITKKKEKRDNLEKEICYLTNEKFDVSYTGNTDVLPRNLGRNARWILSSPIKAITTPFAYTMPKSAWDIMLRRTNTLFYTPNDLGLKQIEEACTKKTEYSFTLPKRQLGSGALFSFLEKLNQPQIKTGINITLVGHSMGAIVVNKIILLEPNLPYKKIIHLASADSINNLFNIVVPYIDYDIEKCKKSGPSSDCNEQTVKFYSFMLDPDNENREESWSGLLPSGSLLTWIDEMYTSPETVFDRRSGRWDNIKKVIPYLPADVKWNMHFKILGIKGTEKCTNEKNCPQKHGDFDEIRFWDKTTWE
ncbi:MAG TPA: hypothetical protein VLS94_01040 [Fusibacter sp.]|nr:hypothetical protein [Fusibacter sp.]